MYMNMHIVYSVYQYYVSARHMALAKAFPESYVYEPQDPTSVGNRFN